MYCIQFILTITERQSKEGHICSGCYISGDDQDTAIYEVIKGKFLLVILIFYYSLLSLMAVGCCFVYCVMVREEYRCRREQSKQNRVE